VRGYRQVIIDCQNYLEHRIIWLYVFGAWHDGEIDHLNGARDDNRISNLRAVDKSLNMRNARRPSRNTSGHIGVTWDAWSGKWKAQIAINGKNQSLGRYLLKSDAVAARKRANEANNFTDRHGC
jgi:hypothetical protein